MMAINRDKNEPGRFLGEGVSFRAKLIGVLEVPEARGDRMCQEALADLKMAIRAAGEHKQRIQVHVAIDGLRLRDDKTGDSLYHHPVHKISFIAQDMTDSRAFGYIFGSPDTGHRFFGIKTDKAASQVVIAMRDLFQVVFELKKKEVELAKQQLEGKSSSVRHTASGIIETAPRPKATTSQVESSASTSKPPELVEGGVAELVDLEQELSSLRRGLTQVEGLTPSSDPFGDSFIAATQNQKGLLPPPPSGSSVRGRSTTSTSTKVFSPGKGSVSLPFDPLALDFEPTATAASLVESFTNSGDAQVASPHDVFTELDPLGTGRSRPYVDKKLFFQELKNPPKKQLKDLVPTQTSLLSDLSILPVEKNYTTMTSLSRQSGGTVSVTKGTSQPQYGSYFSSDPFAENDPFDNADPFDSFKEDPFIGLQEFPKSILKSEDVKSVKKDVKELRYNKVEKDASSDGKNVFNGPLQVTLPPELTPKSPRLQRQSKDSNSIRRRPTPSTKLPSESASPPPPLPPKKIVENNKPPPRPPHDPGPDEIAATDIGPPLPKPSRKKEPYADRSMKPIKQLSATTNSSSEEYLTPAPPPLPSARRFDITLSQLLVCNMEELSSRLRVPEATLSCMTLPQLTEYLRSYLAADIERANIHIEPTTNSTKTPKEKNSTLTSAPLIPSDSKIIVPPLSKGEFTPQFEDNFTPPDTNGTFVANFDDFEVKANPTYDRYAAFREIQELELNSKSILDPDPYVEESKNDSDEKEELTAISKSVANTIIENNRNDNSKSPLRSLDELTLDSFNMFRNSVSPKTTQIDAKIEEIKPVFKNLQTYPSRSISPKENNTEKKIDSHSDRYAALRDITISEPPDEFESLPSEPHVPKERKRSDEKSDGFDNSDFFDCIDNSSLSFSHVDDAFRKSPRSDDDGFGKSPRFRGNEFRKSPRFEEDVYIKTSRVDDNSIRNSPHKGAIRKSPQITEDVFRKSPRFEEDVFKKTFEDGDFGETTNLELDAFKNSLKLGEEEFGKAQEDAFRKSPRFEEDSFKNSPRLENEAFKSSPRLKNESLKKSPRFEEDSFKKSPRFEADSYKKSPRFENDSFKKATRYEEEKKSPRFEEKSRFEEDIFKKGACFDEDAFAKTPRFEDDAFTKSPRLKKAVYSKNSVVKERTEVRVRDELKEEGTKESVEEMVRSPQRLSTGSISDVASASSPDTKDKQVRARTAVTATRTGRWAVLGAGASAGSSDSEPRAMQRRRDPRHRMVSSSSSRDVSPWDEEPPPRRPQAHHRDRESRHGSSGSRECLDSGSGREKDKRDKRGSRAVSIDSRDSRDRDSLHRRDSASPRDRRDSKDRDHREHRRTRSSRERDRDRDNDSWDRNRTYSRSKEYRDRRDRSNYSRDRRKARHSLDEDEGDYSDGCGSGRSSPRDRWAERWRRDDRNYGSLGWRESRRRNDTRPTEDADRRYMSTVGWSRRSGRRDERDRETHPRDTRDSREPRDERDSRRRLRKDEQRSKPRDYRFSNDFSPREGSREHVSPFDNDFQDTPTPQSAKVKRGPAPYSSLEGNRFSFDPSEASPASLSSTRRDEQSASTRFRFDSDSISPRSMFEDDFAAIPPPRGRTASIAEEDEGELPPLRVKPPSSNRDIKKSESINIFTRENDPFEGDAFFACTGSDKAARRENWPGDF